MAPRNQLQQSHDHGDRYTPTTLANAGYTPFTEAAMRQWRRQVEPPKGVVHSHQNAHDDKVCAMLVLDSLLRLDNETPFTAKDLADRLNHDYPQVVWNATAVGRILGSILVATEDISNQEDQRPLVKGAKNGNTMYRLSITTANWVWLGTARHQIGLLAEEEVEEERRTARLKAKTSFPWEAFTTATAE